MYVRISVSATTSVYGYLWVDDVNHSSLDTSIFPVSGTVNPVVTPVLTVSPTSLTLPTTTQGTAGATTTFTVSGSGLGSGDTVNLSTPTGCEISTSSSSGFGTALALYPDASGTLSITTVYARISASATTSVYGYLWADDVNHSSLDTSIFPVSGTVNPVVTPVLTVSPTSLTLPATTQGTVGATTSFTVSGSGLGSGDTVNLSTPTGCEISTSSSSGFGTALSLYPNGSGTLSSTTVYARISASATTSVYGYLWAEDVNHSSLDTSIFPVSGTVNPVVTPVLTVSPTSLTLPTTTQGTAGATTTFTVSGSGLGSGDTLTLWAPTGSEISKDGSTFVNTTPLYPDANGNLTTSTVYIRSSASAMANVSGNLTITDALNSSLDKSISVSGTVQAAPVQPNQSTTTLTSSYNPSVACQSVTFMATVSSSTGTPTGSVTFEDGSTILGTQPLTGSTASITTITLAVGTHTITAVYGGDGTFAGGTSTVVQTVNQISTTTTLISSANTLVFGQSVSFTATVNPASSAPAPPTGFVTFKSGNTVLGTGTLSAGLTASLTATNLPVGTDTVTGGFQRRRQLQRQHLRAACQRDGQPGQHKHHADFVVRPVELRPVSDLYGDRQRRSTRFGHADRRCDLHGRHEHPALLYNTQRRHGSVRDQHPVGRQPHDHGLLQR